MDSIFLLIIAFHHTITYAWLLKKGFTGWFQINFPDLCGWFLIIF